MAAWGRNSRASLLRSLSLAKNNVGSRRLHVPIPSGVDMPAFSGASMATHTMGNSLKRYLDIKVHPMVHQANWRKIIVVGLHDRSAPSIVSTKEKRDKPFNWQRPTARAIDDTLYIQCFPGADHVWHHAAILATHFNITKGPEAAKTVFYRNVEPGVTFKALERSNLSALPPVDVVILGLVHRLESLTCSTSWHGEAEAPFGWASASFGPQKVAFLGFRPSYWGSIAGDLVRVLAACGVKEVLYFGKLGSLKPDVRPNHWLATGNASTINDRTVTWSNILDNAFEDEPVQRGVHYTLPSVLSETHDWLAAVQRDHTFVDPEIGCMAQAAVETGVKFGYLHLISDNVAQKYEEDLSNERMESVLEGRNVMYQHVNRVFHRYLGGRMGSYDGATA